LYDAQQPAPPQASGPPPGQWGYHSNPPPQHHGAPISASHGGGIAPLPSSYNPHPSQQPPPPQHGASLPSHFPPPSHAQRSYFQPPHPPPHGMQPPPPHKYQQQQAQHQQPSYYGSHPPPPQPPHQPPHSYPQYGSWPNPAPPPHQLPPHQPPSQQHPPPPHQPMLAPRSSLRTGRSPPKNGTLPSPPHPLIPTDIGHHEPETIHTSTPPPEPIRAGAPTPATHQQQHQQASRTDSHGNRHVQFQNTALVASLPPPVATVGRSSSKDPRRNIEDNIPLIISSKNRIKPRSRHHRNSDRSPDDHGRSPRTLHSSLLTPSSPSTQNLSLSPKSRADHSRGGMTNNDASTHMTPLTFQSTDMSVRTSDSLSHYLKGIEDEISGDVGQEVELIAHAPMLDQHQQQQKMDSRNYRGGGEFVCTLLVVCLLCSCILSLLLDDSGCNVCLDVCGMR